MYYDCKDFSLNLCINVDRVWSNHLILHNLKLKLQKCYCILIIVGADLHLMIALCAHQWYALLPILRGRWEIRGKLTCPNGTSPHNWGTILCIIPLHIPYKYPISPCCGQYVTRRYGRLDVTIMTKYPSLGEDSDGKPPPFPHYLPQARFGIPLIGALYDNYTVY